VVEESILGYDADSLGNEFLEFARSSAFKMLEIDYLAK
jgi:hypothetical protein